MASGAVERFFLSVLVTIAVIEAVSSTANFTFHGDITSEERETLNNLLSNSSSERTRRAADIFASFPTYNQINSWMDGLHKKYGSAVTVENVAQTEEGRQIKSIIINFTNAWKTVFIVATLHAREWGATIAALYVINELTNNFESYQNLTFRFIIIPVANPDGYVYTFEKDRFWRKNRSRQPQGTFGVDLNRNFGYKWTKVFKNEETYPSDETYRGPKPFSEIESRVIKKAMLVLRQWLVLFVDLQSPGQNVLYPWGFTSRPPRNEENIRSVAEAAAQAILDEAGTTYQCGTVSDLQGSVGGTALDYCHAIDVNACLGVEVGTEIHMEVQEIPQLGQEAMAAIGAMALNDEKQIDFAEQLESVAYVLCGDGTVTYDKFCQIWHAKGILDKLYRLIDVDSTNQVSTNQIMEFISNLTNSRPRTGFDKSSLERLEQLFIKTVGNEKEIRREEFKKIVTSKNPFFTERVFQIFDKDNSGSISLQEFIDAIHQFAGQSPEDKIKFLFKVYDLDGDGLIQHRELQHVMRACMEENGMRFSEDQIEDLTMAMFEDADKFNRGAITYEALKNQLEKHGGLLENLSISIDRWLVPLPQEDAKTKRKKKPLPHQLTAPYIKNNYVYLSFLTIFTIINVGLFVSRAIQYRESNGFVILARACGQCLNFNCAFILVLMLRQCITFLRTRGFTAFLPLDQHIYLHKLTGVLVAVFSLVHTIMHLFNFTTIVVYDPEINADNYTTAEWLFTARPGKFGLIGGCANPTGIVLALILLIMFVCSQPFVRRGGSFEVFYWTHLLYVPFWILVLFHGPNFWKWFIGPGLIYLVERTIRLVWMRTEHGKTYISSGLLLPSKVTHLVIKRPLHFCFRPGDYVFVNIPAIAQYEWHPFTLSSAPEQEDYIWLHIRGVGEWTNRLHHFFEREQDRLHNGEIPALVAGSSGAPIASGASVELTQERIGKPSAAVMAAGGAAAAPGAIHKSSSFESALNKPKTVSAAGGPAGPRSDPTSPAGIMKARHPPGTSKLAMEGYSAATPAGSGQPKFDRQMSENRALKKIQATLQRTFSRRDQLIPRSGAAASVGGIANEAFSGDGVDGMDGARGSDMKDAKRKVTPEQSLHKLIFQQKVPLEKSLSMPDMQNKFKKRERMMVLREYMRSESERSFDEVQIRKARLQSLGLAYLSPQNKSLAQSFRYMRNKPTIIAFKTPSLENCEPRDSTNSIVVSPGVFTQKDAEEGRGVPAGASGSIGALATVTGGSTGASSTPAPGEGSRPVNYPVGKPLEIYIDGPYGAPSSHIFQAQHAVLIATGIGVTPFASILQSIMHRYWKARHCCPRCSFEWSSEIPPTIMNLRKVDFFWINRDQQSFEWFVNLLSQLEIEQAELGGAMERFLEMHMYITSALQKTDMKAVGLQLALDLLHEKEKRDLITGLKTRTNAGRPNWDKVFKQIQDQKKGKVTVFYCGPPQLAKTLRYKCDQFGFQFRKEVF